jgi:hypothetical protein
MFDPAMLGQRLHRTTIFVPMRSTAHVSKLDEAGQDFTLHQRM